MLSKVSVYEVFMHYFKKMSARGSTFGPRWCPPLEKLLRAPCSGLMKTENHYSEWFINIY